MFSCCCTGPIGNFFSSLVLGWGMGNPSKRGQGSGQHSWPNGNQEPIRPVSPNPRGDRRTVESFPSRGWGLQRILASEDSLPSSQHPRLGTTKHPRGRDRKGWETRTGLQPSAAMLKLCWPQPLELRGVKGAPGLNHLRHRMRAGLGALPAPTSWGERRPRGLCYPLSALFFVHLLLVTLQIPIVSAFLLSTLSLAFCFSSPFPPSPPALSWQDFTKWAEQRGWSSEATHSPRLLSAPQM